LRLFQRRESRYVERRFDTEWRSIDRRKAQLPILDPNMRKPGGMARVEVAVDAEHCILPRRGQHRQAAIVMMPVPLDVMQTEKRHHCQILLQSHRAEVAQVLARQDSRAPLRVPHGQKTRVRDAFDNALAVLVARARVTEIESPGKVSDRAVGFIDDERRTILPALERTPGGVGQRVIAVNRLLEDERPVTDFSQPWLSGDPLPEDSKRIEVLEVFIAVNGELKLTAGQFRRQT